MAGIVGIDVGGTFTDLYFSGGEGRAHHILKVPSTPHDPSVGLLHALEKAHLQPGELDAILHGTTIATNNCAQVKVGAKSSHDVKNTSCKILKILVPSNSLA